MTLGLVLDGSGFVRRSQSFAGNVSEPGTPACMLAATGNQPAFFPPVVVLARIPSLGHEEEEARRGDDE